MVQYKIKKSTRKNKQLMAILPSGKKVHFGDPKMPEYPGTKRGDAYCTRSLGITDKKGNKTANDINSPNYWSRKYLWNCKGKKSLKRRFI